MNCARYTVLVIDDEPNMLHMLKGLLEDDGYTVSTASDAGSALNLATENSFDFILSDIRMPGMDGIKLLEHLKERSIDSIIILMSAYGTMELALEAIRKGAYDYISKPFKTDEVTLTFRKAAERERLRREVIKLRRRLSSYEHNSEIIAQSNGMKDVLHQAAQIAPFDSTVLVTGESGTGKELIAREIHRLSSRNAAAFVPLNCGAIPHFLLESELFGHARGAFTGAIDHKMGLFEEAHQGTLFLDEIGNLPIILQSKLLRAIDTGEIRRIGETKMRKVSVRIIAATNENLTQAIEQGRFRNDLYFRLSVVNIHIPPLRERKEDILPLIEYFVSHFNTKLGFKTAKITSEAKQALVSYNWKGNIRELQNVIERAMILTQGSTIGPESLPEDVGHKNRFLEYGIPVSDDLSLKRAYKELEKRYILRALNKTGGNRSQAASLLEISYPSLLQKIKELGIA